MEKYAKGKRDPSNRKSVSFGSFLTTLPTVPLIDLAPNFTYPMDGNDKVGDCVVAGFDHFMQVVTGLLGTQENFTQDEIWAFYKTQNPNFDPNSPTNGAGSMYDNGMDIQKFLEYLVSKNYILGFASVDWKNEAELKSAIYLGLGLISGVQMTQAQMEQFPNSIWDYVPNSPSDGGHCIPLVGYVGTPDAYTCVTWGKLVQCMYPFILNQMDECWFVLTQDHVDHPNFREHFDLAGFSQAVSAITDGKVVIPVNPVLKQGSSGLAVQILQNQLNELNNAGLISDGQFGPKTKIAVMNFQTLKHLVVDGIVGKMTWQALQTLNTPMNTISIQQSTTDLIEQFEGLSLTPYQDVGGVWTIGYGATYDLNGNPITANTPPLTQGEATQLLAKQLQIYADAVTNTIKVPLNQNQFDSCTSLCYNIGVNGFEESTVARMCNANDFQSAAKAFLLWDKVKGVVNQGLLARRNEEMNLFLKNI